MTAITLSPAIFAFVCTMGTLKVMGHPLDIPALMLAIIIMGMGSIMRSYWSAPISASGA